MNDIFNKFKENDGKQIYDPQIIHHFGTGVYARQATLKAGSIVNKHSHTYTHLSILASGKVRLLTNKGDAKELIGPCCIEVPANTQHAVEILEDAIWFCIHATEFADVNDLDNVTIGTQNV